MKILVIILVVLAITALGISIYNFVKSVRNDNDRQSTGNVPPASTTASLRSTPVAPAARVVNANVFSGASY